MIANSKCRYGLPAAALLALLSWNSALAQSEFLPYASTQFEHNNNIFALPNSAAAVMANGSPQLGDSDLKTIAGFDENYLWDRQRFYATVEGRYQDFDHFTDLNHYEYLAKGGLDWKLFSAFDGTLSYSQERVMAPFQNRDSQTELELNLERIAIAKVNFTLTPEWRLETSETYHDLDSPIQDFPDYGLSEETTHIALRYLGVANLTFGVSADYLDGEYRNAPLLGNYDQRSAGLTMTYALSGLSTFNGAVGYSKRDLGEGQGTLSGVTGNLGYTRNLGPKTAVFVNLSRNINSYVGAGGSELDSTALVGVNYQATFKIGLVLQGQYTKSDFTGQTVPIPGGIDQAGRVDHLPGATFKMDYQALRWLLIQPYAIYQRRSSNFEAFEFSSTTIGIKILVKKPARQKNP